MLMIVFNHVGHVIIHVKNVFKLFLVIYIVHVCLRYFTYTLICSPSQVMCGGDIKRLLDVTSRLHSNEFDEFI
jgi:hypothetical protein